MAEEPLITESKRPQIKAIIKSIFIINFRVSQKNLVKERSVILVSQKT